MLNGSMLFANGEKYMAGDVGADQRTDAERAPSDGIFAFVVLACAITWTMGMPLVSAWMNHRQPPAYALALAGFSAFGPTLAAVAITAARGQASTVFGPWRTRPWIVLAALFVPMTVHLLANTIEVTLGGRPAQWFYPPVKPEHVAALIFFSLGEEFGWRGFAYPRFAERYGVVGGSLLLGLAWGAWHLMMTVSPDTGTFNWSAFAVMLVELPLYSVVLAWLLENGNRSLAIAIAFHAGGHLDNVSRAPETEIRLRVLRFVVLVTLAALAGWALNKRASRKAESASPQGERS